MPIIWPGPNELGELMQPLLCRHSDPPCSLLSAGNKVIGDRGTVYCQQLGHIETRILKPQSCVAQKGCFGCRWP